MKYFIFILSLSVFLMACSSKSAEDYVFEGVKMTREYRLKEAIEFFSKAIELKPDYSEAYKLRGQTKFNMGDATGALEDFTFAIEYDVNNAEAYYNRGSVYAFFNNRQQACLDYKKAKELNYPNIDDSYRMCLQYE